MLKAKKRKLLKSMPKTPKFSLKGKKKQVITIVVVVLLLALAAGTGVFVQWLQQKNGNNNKGGGNNTGDTNINVKPDGTVTDNLPDSVKDAQQTALSGNYDESNKQIASSLATTSDNREKFNLYMQQGINYENEQKWNDAMNSYKQAEALQKTWSVYRAMGRVAESQGDKAAAVGYYKKALPLIPDDPLREFNTNEMNAKITELGG
jgi:tetratricopeptide (TPR) repeat protein